MAKSITWPIDECEQTTRTLVSSDTSLGSHCFVRIERVFHVDTEIEVTAYPAARQIGLVQTLTQVDPETCSPDSTTTAISFRPDEARRTAARLVACADAVDAENPPADGGDAP